MVEKLTPNTIRELWGKTYNSEGKPDWSHIFPYYHDDIVFQDSIQKIEGIEEFSDGGAGNFYAMDHDNDLQQVSKYADVWLYQVNPGR